MMFTTPRSTAAELEALNLRFAVTAEELTAAWSFAINGEKLLVVELAPVFGPVRAPCAAVDAIELVLPPRRPRRK
jgi:hypothetical protein